MFNCKGEETLLSDNESSIDQTRKKKKKQFNNFFSSNCKLFTQFFYPISKNFFASYSETKNVHFDGNTKKLL